MCRNPSRRKGQKAPERHAVRRMCSCQPRVYIHHNTAAPGLEALLCFFRAKNKKLTFSIEICSAACYTIQACRVGISVLLQLPKLARRVRLPYPAPHRCGLYCPQRFLLPFLPRHHKRIFRRYTHGGCGRMSVPVSLQMKASSHAQGMTRSSAKNGKRLH